MKKERTVYEFLNVRPAFVDTTGKFYTSISSLEALEKPEHDPLMKAVARLAAQKAMDAASVWLTRLPVGMNPYIEPEPPSEGWKRR